MNGHSNLSSLAPPVGTIIKNRFVLQEVIGEGGMGTVYKAIDRMAEQAHDKNPYVAIKVLHPDLAGNQAFFVAMQREAAHTMQLAHPNIVLLRDFDKDGAYVYLCMEYLQGQPLSKVIKELPPGGMAFEKAWPIIEGMGNALAYAHQKSIVHADFKPSNVLLTDNGNVKVIDFGIARHIGFDDKTKIQAIQQAYTPAYSTIEMIKGEDLNQRDDVFSLACVIYELLSGKHPFGRRVSADDALSTGVKPNRIISLDKRQWNALLQGLALERNKRMASIDALLTGLRSREIRQTSWILISVAMILLFAIAAIASTKWLPCSSNFFVYLQNHPPLPDLSGQNVATSSECLVKIAVEANAYHIGDKLKIHYAVAKPLYLSLYYVNSSGEQGLLYPEKGMKPLPLVPGKDYQFPRDDEKFDLTIEGPVGSDQIIAVARDKPVSSDFPVIIENDILTGQSSEELVSFAKLKILVD